MLQILDIHCPWLGVPGPVERLACRRRSRSGSLWNYKRGLNPVEAAAAEEDSDAARKKKYSLPSVQNRKRVVLVRHGQSTWNEIGRIQGSSDISRLTPKGENQAEISRQMLLSDSFNVCIHSPLSRAKLTAEIIWGSARDHNDMIPIDDLREIDLYAFQGLYKEQGKQLFGDLYTKWKKDPANFIVDGHYPVRELWERASECWSSILGHEGSSILVVAHNAVNQALVGTAIGLEPTYFRHLLQSNCGVSVLDFSPRIASSGPPHVCLERLNQTPTSPLSDGQSGARKTGARIVLVCHGATGTSARQQFPSSPSEPLSPLGAVQAAKIGEHLVNIPVHSIFCSPELRAAKTADLIRQNSEREDLKITALEQLRDLDWGLWRGRSKDEVLTSSTGRRWQNELELNSFAGEETFESFCTRAAQAWQSLIQHLDAVQSDNDGEGTVLVVGHSTVNDILLCHCLGLDQTHVGSFQFDNASLSVIDFPDGASGRGVVRCLNYTSHLDRWAAPVTRRRLQDAFVEIRREDYEFCYNVVKT